MAQKTITIPTNYNGKLACDAFLHIAEAPADLIPESVLQNTDVMVQTADGSHPPVRARLVDLSRTPMYQLSSLVTYASHGMGLHEYQQWVVEQNPRLSIVSKMCVYIYQKINE